MAISESAAAIGMLVDLLSFNCLLVRQLILVLVDLDIDSCVGLSANVTHCY